MAGSFPIIYVRGFAGRPAGIDEAIDDPLLGFNEGSTHVRVGGAGDPVFYQFEGPILRLLDEMGYRLHVQGGQEAFLDEQPDGSLSEQSLWVHRFYDRSASTWTLGRPEPFSIEAAAQDLLGLVEKVRAKTGAPRVHLVAHSMGGLICRSMIQRVVPDRGRGVAARNLVDRLFTYGTPHGGIEFEIGFGLLEAIRDEFGVAGADIFGRERMYEYLTPASQRQRRVPEEWHPRVNPDEDNFPTSRIFCLVGTNATDYAVAHGLSKRAVGVKSDGLVQIGNALVTDATGREADHAYVHRSHSGRYGLVNSEEGYQNLVRFLFGDVRVTADLVHLHFPGAEAFTWQAETWVSIRGLPVLLHARKAAHHCPVLIEESNTDDPADRPVPLVTTYLWSERARDHGRMRYVVNVRILSLREKGGIFSWVDHTEGSTDFDDYLVVDVEQRPGDQLAAWATWGSDIAVPLRAYESSGEALTDLDKGSGSFRAEVPLPRSGAFLGGRGALALSVRPAT